MKVLLIKMSSMGDIFHTFPALTDLQAQVPSVEVTWVVEESFKEIAAWHPVVKKVIPIQLRKWMQDFNFKSWREYQDWKKNLQTESYDLVIDAQGLLKSAIITRAAKTLSTQKRFSNKHGFDKDSARESFASYFYSNLHFVDKNQHAVDRTRQLFAQIFDYELTQEMSFGIQQNFKRIQKSPRKLVFIIGTSWVTKLWSTLHWQRLAALAIEEGYDVEIMWGSPREQLIADAIIASNPKATRPIQRMSITTIAEKLVAAAGVVGLDTGFSHLAGALETPTVALYGATSPVKVGLIGAHTANLQTEQELNCMPCHKRQCKWLAAKSSETPPCMNGIKPHLVWQTLSALMPKPKKTKKQDEESSR